VKFVDINPQITQIDADYAERIKGAYGIMEIGFVDQ
jgi:hypothetical protein